MDGLTFEYKLSSHIHLSVDQCARFDSVINRLILPSSLALPAAGLCILSSYRKLGFTICFSMKCDILISSAFIPPRAALCMRHDERKAGTRQRLPIRKKSCNFLSDSRCECVRVHVGWVHARDKVCVCTRAGLDVAEGLFSMQTQADVTSVGRWRVVTGACAHVVASSTCHWAFRPRWPARPAPIHWKIRKRGHSNYCCACVMDNFGTSILHFFL